MDRGRVIEILESGIEICNVTKTTQVHINVSVAERIVELLKEQEAEIRQLRLALDIAKGTCKGIKSGGGQFADMPTMQSAT